MGCNKSNNVLGVMLLSCTQRVSIFFVVMAFDTRLVHMTVYLRSICTQLIFVLKALLTSYARHSLWVTIMLPFYYQDTCIITTCWIMLAPHLRLNDKCVNKFICHLTTLYALLYQFIECLAFWYLNFLSNNKMLKWLNAALKDNLMIVCIWFLNFLCHTLSEKEGILSRHWL